MILLIVRIGNKCFTIDLSAQRDNCRLYQWNINMDVATIKTERLQLKDNVTRFIQSIEWKEWQHQPNIPSEIIRSDARIYGYP